MKGFASLFLAIVLLSGVTVLAISQVPMSAAANTEVETIGSVHNNFATIASSETETEIERFERLVAENNEVSRQETTYKDTVFVYNVIDGNAYVVDASSKKEKVVVPATLDGYPLVGFVEGSVSNMSAGIYAFEVEKDSRYFKSIDGVLYDYGLQTLILYPRDKTGTQYVIPKETIAIAKNAFKACGYLKEITLHSNIQYIGKGAFSNNESIELLLTGNNQRYSILEGVLFDMKARALHTYLPSNAKSKYEIPEWVEGIYSSAFVRCDSLISVVIPEGVKYMEKDAFFACKILKTMNIPASVEEMDKNSIRGCFQLSVSTVPNSYGALFAEKNISGPIDINLSDMTDEHRVDLAAKAITKLKNKMKNPNSLQVHSITGIRYTRGSFDRYVITIDYSGMNGFGGYSREKAYYYAELANGIVFEEDNASVITTVGGMGASINVDTVMKKVE